MYERERERERKTETAKRRTRYPVEGARGNGERQGIREREREREIVRARPSGPFSAGSPSVCATSRVVSPVETREKRVARAYAASPM